MADDSNTYTRVNRFEKKRKNTKNISILYVVGGLLTVALIGLLIFGGSEQVDTVNESLNKEEADPGNDNENSDNNENNDPVITDDGQDSDEADPASPEEVEIEELELPADENVIKAYTANWQPVETEIQAFSDFSWEKEAQDWQQLIEAVSLATGLEKDTMIQWRVENGHGKPSDVVATVTDKAQTEVYRVYVSLLDQGWQTDKVEVLKENDKK